MDTSLRKNGPQVASYGVPLKHDYLWFPDGNVVLATDSLLFRIHKGVLALHSTVFKDLFDLPITSTGGGQDGGEPSRDGVLSSDLYDGVPTVMLSGDKGEDVAHLLRPIYERDYYHRDDDDTPLEKVIALLSLSAEYDVATVRKDVLKQLSRTYPTILEEYESSVARNSSLFGRPRSECHFPLLRGVITPQSDVQIILPALFYSCTTIPFRKIIQDEAPHLPSPVLQTLLLGERNLNFNTHTLLNCVIVITSLSTGCPFKESAVLCNTARTSTLWRKVDALFETSDLLAVEGADVVDAVFERRCAWCRQRITDVVGRIKSRAWDMIPECFDFKR